MHAPLLLMPPTAPATHLLEPQPDHWEISRIMPSDQLRRQASQALVRVSIEHIDDHGITSFGTACYVTFDWAYDEHDAACRAGIDYLIKEHDLHIRREIEQMDRLEAELEEEA